MATPMSTRARRLWLGALVFATVCGIDFLGRSDAATADDLLVLAMSVETPEGAVVGSPVVVGAPGQRVEVRLQCERDPATEKMSVVLDPLESTDDGTLRYSYSLSFAGGQSRAQGTVELTPGREQRLRLSTGGPRPQVTFALYAAPVSRPGVGRYLRERRARLGLRAT